MCYSLSLCKINLLSFSFSIKFYFVRLFLGSRFWSAWSCTFSVPRSRSGSWYELFWSKLVKCGLDDPAMDPKDRVLFQPMIMIQFWSIFFILFIVHTSKSMFEDSPDLIHLVLEDNNISDLGKPSILLKQTYI